MKNRSIELQKITDYNSVLIIVPAKVIADADLEILKLLSDSKIPCIYLSFNKTCKNILENLEKSNVDKSRIHIIDCVSSSKDLIGKSVYKGNISDLTEINILIKDLVQKIKNETYSVIDDMSTLLIYHTKETIARFMHNLTAKVSENELKLIVLTTYMEEYLMDKVVPFFDKVIEIKS